MRFADRKTFLARELPYDVLPYRGVTRIGLEGLHVALECQIE